MPLFYGLSLVACLLLFFSNHGDAWSAGVPPFRTALPTLRKITSRGHTVTTTSWSICSKSDSNRKKFIVLHASTAGNHQDSTVPADASPVSSRIHENIEQELIPNTMKGALKIFFFSQYLGPPLCMAGIVILLVCRLFLLATPVTVMDLAVSVFMVFIWWFQEHFMHLHLLHSKQEWYGKKIHQKHHEKPYFQISIDPAWLMIGWLVSAHFFLRCFLPLPFAVSATIGYAAAGLFYEWAHFIVHTKVRFERNSYWQRLKSHHIRHHLVDSTQWLAFSVPRVDSLFGTNPDIHGYRQGNATSKAW